MNDQEKNKENLIIECLELKKENSDLKSLYEDIVAENRRKDILLQQTLKTVDSNSDETILRQKAEEQLEKKKSSSIFPEWEFNKILHELEVHQIQLEMQNEEIGLAYEQAILAKEDYANLYDYSPTAYFTLSKEGEIVKLNFRAASMLNKDRIDFMKSNFGFFVSEDTRPIFNLFFDRVFTSKINETCEVVIITEGQGFINVYIEGIGFQDNQQCLLTVVDITKLKQAEEEIKLKSAELLKLNSEKDKFFSIIAHDLRGPFAGFLGLTEIMAVDLPNLTKTQIQEFAVGLNTSATNLYRLLTNLLEWSKIQNGTVSFFPATINLIALVDECLSLLEESAINKEIEMGVDIYSDLEIFADSNMLKTVIRNLVSNAFKFTPKRGKVKISAKMNNNFVKISINDTGIGMNQQLIDDLFRIDVKTGRQGTEGELSTGLGLLLCKEFVEKHHGKLWVESVVGVGTTFNFSLPCKANLACFV